MSLRARRWGLTRADAWALGVCGALVLVRLATLLLSTFGIYHGANEALYSIVALGFLDHPLLATYHDTPFFETPPLAAWVIALSFKIFGPSLAAARRPSLIAECGAIVGVFFAARKLAGPTVARWSAVTFALLPWDIFWYGRAQTDPYMVALLSLALGLILHHPDRRWTLPAGGIAVGLAGAAKQPAILFVGVVALWTLTWRAPRSERLRFAGRLAPWIVVGGIPIASYYVYHLIAHPHELIAQYSYQATSRAVPFENTFYNILVGLGVGVGPIALVFTAFGILRTREILRDPFFWWLAIYGAFVAVRTPHLHEYYLVAIMPPVAYFAARGLVAASEVRGRADRHRSGALRLAGGAVMAVAGIAVLIVFMGIKGELGDRTSRDAAVAVLDYVKTHPNERVAIAAVGLPFADYEEFYLKTLGGANLPFKRYVCCPPTSDILSAQPGYDRVLIVTSQAYTGETPPSTPYVGLTQVAAFEYRFLGRFMTTTVFGAT